MKVRVGSGNKDYHYTHWTVLLDRLLSIDVPELSRQPEVIPPDGLDPILFFCQTKSVPFLSKFIIIFSLLRLENFKDVAFIKRYYKVLKFQYLYIHLLAWKTYHCKLFTCTQEDLDKRLCVVLNSVSILLHCQGYIFF